MKNNKMIDFGEFKSTVCTHGKAVIQCGICFDPKKIRDVTEWRVRLTHPIMYYRMRKSLKQAQKADL